MLLKTKKSQFCFPAMTTWLVFLFFIFTTQAYAAETVNIADMIKNLAETIPQLMQLTTAISYVLGFYFVYHSILLLKKYGLQRTQMSGDASLTPALLFMFAGAALIFLPSSIYSGIGTFWTDTSPLRYDTSDNGEWQDFYNAVFLIIQLVGTIAFIRGLILLTKLGGSGGGQQGGAGKAVAHIVGGVFCINIYGFIDAVFTTLGLGTFLG